MDALTSKREVTPHLANMSAQLQDKPSLFT